MKLDELTFKIDGDPFGKQRPRVLRTGRAYTPKETVAYEMKTIRSFRTASRGRFYADEGTPVCVVIKACFRIPKNTSKKQRAQMESGEILPMKKPDCDNIQKVVLDALNKLAYADDKQVVSSAVEKRYAKDKPYVLVTIRKELNNEVSSVGRV